MTVHTKWEILVKKLLKLVKLFKSYGLFGEPKVVDFLGFFFEKCKKKKTFLDRNIFFSLPIRSSCFLLLYCILLILQKEVLYTPVGVIWKKFTEFKTLKIAFGLSFFNLCVSRPLVQTTRFVVKYLQKPLTCKAKTCITVNKLPSL
jgi:hypothetical protein